MSNQMKKIDKGTQLFVLVGMWAEAQTKVPEDVLQHKLATMLKGIKATDPKEFNGLKAFLKARGIDIHF